MRYFTMLCTAAALSLTAIPAANAQAQQTCPLGHCQQQPGQQSRQQPAQAQAGKADANAPARTQAPAPKAAAAHAAPRPGGSAKGAPRFERAANSRLKAPPHGQDYRVVDGHLVLVDSSTLKVVSVVGLLSSLLK